uniref:Uncharacterized protein n=1 Tax=viral metagenome TaxID=1070528 RepID=A0A6C0FBS3_9ZZZZ|tara:strand:+ start:4942 stop:5316 length:375 start_codon:yes stop_codon:yes gene_type:complete
MITVRDYGKYISLKHKKIRVVSTGHYTNGDSEEFVGTCRVIPVPQYIIGSIHNDIIPSVGIYQENHKHIVYTPLTQVQKLFWIKKDILPTIYSFLVCKRLNISRDIARYIATFTDGWETEEQIV